MPVRISDGYAFAEQPCKLEERGRGDHRLPHQPHLSTHPRVEHPCWHFDPRRFGIARSATTNLAFSDWPTVFPNASSAVGLIDRIVHHADVISIEGESFRRREAELAQATRRPKRKP